MRSRREDVQDEPLKSSLGPHRFVANWEPGTSDQYKRHTEQIGVGRSKTDVVEWR